MNNHRKPANNKENMFYFNKERTGGDNAPTIFLSLPTKIFSARNGFHLVEQLAKGVP